MTTVMFFTGTVVGLFLGAILWEWLVTIPEARAATRREHRLNGRVQAWQRMYLYAEGARVATSRAMFRSTHPDADTFSRKVPDLTVIR